MIGMANSLLMKNNLTELFAEYTIDKCIESYLYWHFLPFYIMGKQVPPNLCGLLHRRGLWQTAQEK